MKKSGPMLVVDCTDPAKALLSLFNAAVARAVEARTVEMAAEATARARRGIEELLGGMLVTSTPKKSPAPRRKPAKAKRSEGGPNRRARSKGSPPPPPKAKAAPKQRRPAGRACGKCGKVTDPAHNARSCPEDDDEERPVRGIGAAAEQLAADHQLSGRQADVVTALARGVKRTELGQSLKMGEGTVKTHIKAVLKKTGDRDTGELVARVVRGAAGAGAEARRDRIARGAARIAAGRVTLEEQSRRAIAEARRPARPIDPEPGRDPDEDIEEPPAALDLSTLQRASFEFG